MVSYFFGNKTFAVVGKCKYNNEIVSLKKPHSNLQQNVTNIFTKEALLLPKIM